MKSKLLTLTAAAFAATGTCLTHAGTVDSASFNGVTDGAISTSGFIDWGYLSFDDTGFGTNGLFDSNLGGTGASLNDTVFDNVTSNNGDNLTTVGGSSPIGSVLLTEGTSGTDTVSSQDNTSNYTFDGNTAYGSYGNFGPTEQDIWQLDFIDLGAGTFTISLYMGHSDNGRSFDMDYVLTDDVTTTGTTTMSNTIGDLGSAVAAYDTSGSAFTYDITVTTATAGADLSLTFGGTGGGSGGAILGGYTIAVPEPSAFALLAGMFGLTWVMLRRRS